MFKNESYSKRFVGLHGGRTQDYLAGTVHYGVFADNLAHAVSNDSAGTRIFDGEYVPAHVGVHIRILEGEIRALHAAVDQL